MSINNHDKLLLPRKNGSTHKPATFLGPSDPGIVPLGEIKNAGYVNPRSSSMRSNTRRMMLKDLGGAVRGMLDDAGYIFAEEYEVGAYVVCINSITYTTNGLAFQHSAYN